MCARCDGMSDEEIEERQVQTILTRGWMTQYVEGDNGPDSPVFAYTAGLSLRGHRRTDLLPHVHGARQHGPGQAREKGDGGRAVRRR